MIRELLVFAERERASLGACIGLDRITTLREHSCRCASRSHASVIGINTVTKSTMKSYVASCPSMSARVRASCLLNADSQYPA